MITKRLYPNHWQFLTFTTYLLLIISLTSCSKDEDSIFDANSYYILTAMHNGKVLDVGCEDVHDPLKPNSDRDNVCAFERHEGQNQQWKIEFLGDGTYKLTARHNGKVLNVGYEDVHDPARPNLDRDNVCVLEGNKSNSQRWKIELLEDGSYRLTAKHNGKVLDVGCEYVHDPSKPNSDLDNVCVFNWHGGGNQRWSIQKITTPFWSEGQK